MKNPSKAFLHLLSLACAASTLLLGGCGAPTSRGLIGDTPKQLDPAEWNGHWRSDDDTFVVRVANAEGGLLEIGSFEEKDNALQLSIMHLYLREEGDATLFNLIDPSEPAQTYTFGRVVRKNNSAIFWPCRNDSLEQLIGKGQITGQVTVKDKLRQVLVVGGYDVVARHLAKPEGWLMLQLEEPAVMIRERTDF